MSDPVKTTRRMMVAANAFEVLADGCGSLRVEEMSEILESDANEGCDPQAVVTPILLTRAVDIANDHFQDVWADGEPRDLTIRYFHRGCEIATRKLHRCVPLAYGEGARSARDKDDQLLESLVIQPREIGRREHSVSFQHPARVRDITFKYGRDWLFGSANQHEWVGYCEGDGNSWIAFFNEHGGGFLYESREFDGSVVGQPLFFYREDVAREYGAYMERAWNEITRPVRVFAHSKVPTNAELAWMIDKLHRSYPGLDAQIATAVMVDILKLRLSYKDFLGADGAWIIRKAKEDAYRKQEEIKQANAALHASLEADKQSDREALGKEVRAVWIGWAKEQPLVKPSWLAPWEELSEPEREVDRRIGERLCSMGLAAKTPSVNP